MTVVLFKDGARLLIPSAWTLWEYRGALFWQTDGQIAPVEPDYTDEHTIWHAEVTILVT